MTPNRRRPPLRTKHGMHAAVIAGALVVLPFTGGCEDEPDNVGEAVEELGDEAEDAGEELDDEVDEIE
jgi:hypothetical protein